MPNNTLNYLFATSPLGSFSFSGVTATSSVNLPGPGGQSGDGFPVSREGSLTGITVWDGATLRQDVGDISLSPGDRLSVYCQSTGSNFTVKVRINGTSTDLLVTGVPYNSTLYVTVEFLQKRV